MQSPGPHAALDDLLHRCDCALERAAALLVDPKPESLEAAQAPLGEATECLNRYCELAPGAALDPARARKAVSIGEKLCRIETLLTHARAFHQGLAQTVSNPGYTPDGAADLGGVVSSLTLDC